MLQVLCTAPYVTLATAGLPGDLAHTPVGAASKCDIATKILPMRTSGVVQRVTMAASFMEVAVTVFLEQWEIVAMVTVFGNVTYYINSYHLGSDACRRSPR